MSCVLYPTKHLCISVAAPLIAQIFCSGSEYGFFGDIWDKFALDLVQIYHLNFIKLCRNEQHQHQSIKKHHIQCPIIFFVQISSRFNAHFSWVFTMYVVRRTVVPRACEHNFISSQIDIKQTQTCHTHTHHTTSSTPHTLAHTTSHNNTHQHTPHTHTEI